MTILATDISMMKINILLLLSAYYHAHNNAASKAVNNGFTDLAFLIILDFLLWNAFDENVLGFEFYERFFVDVVERTHSIFSSYFTDVITNGEIEWTR